MKISRLQASSVHGYLELDVEFLEELTFLTGLNGSGKTTVLRLLMALLTPNLEELSAISFVRAVVSIQDGELEITVSAGKSSDGVTISISERSDALFVSSSDLELLTDLRRRDELRSPLVDKYQHNEILQRIKAITTPMFLGLDRRFFVPGSFAEDALEARRREMITRRAWSEDPNMRGTAMVALAEVNILVQGRLQEVRAAQERLDEDFRTQFFAKAFEYKPAELMNVPDRIPSRAEIDRYRRQLSTIANKAEGARIPVPEIQSALTTFFERMSKIVESMDRPAPAVPSRGPRKLPKKVADRQQQGPTQQMAYVEWLINKPQADRIVEHLAILEKYLEARDSLHDPINRFQSLINGFLKQTRKSVSVTVSGQLSVHLEGHTEGRPISALSSGERQLLVMLAHLSLNPNLAVSGVFIVDEPELSLHIDWQERFVDAVREANPKVQLILATHSPAIILDRIDACCALSG